MHTWNWHDICRSKHEGGVGIRRIKDINDASDIRLVWRLYTSSSLRSTWMKANYLKAAHFTEAKSSVLDFGTWKWICSFEVEAMSHNVSKLGNGNDTSLLYDKWLTGSADALMQILSENQTP